MKQPDWIGKQASKQYEKITELLHRKGYGGSRPQSYGRFPAEMFYCAGKKSVLVVDYLEDGANIYIEATEKNDLPLTLEAIENL